MQFFFRLNLIVILLSVGLLSAGLPLAGLFTEGAMNKKVVLVVASEGFQPVEYTDTKAILDESGIAVVTASEKIGNTIDGFDKAGPEIKVSVTDLNKEKNFVDFAGVFLIGGPGALDCLDNEEVYNLMRKAKEAGILYGAICISPRILCEAGLIDDKKITGWDGDGKLAEECPNAVIIGGPVVVDDKLITARDPRAAREFGEAIVQVLKQ